MIINFNDKDGSPAYRLEPIDNNLCWKLYEWKDSIEDKVKKNTRSGWVFSGSYPTSLPGACKQVAELSLRKAEISVDADILAKTIQRIVNDFVVRTEDVVVLNETA
jgi:hypothetical protein